MPPRAQHTGKRALQKTGATGAGGGSQLRLDTRPVEATAPKHDIAKETQQLDSKVAQCKAGIAWIDLLKIGDQLKFGVYNDRPENETETKKLVASFKASGVVSMKDASAIPLILDLSRIANAEMLADDFKFLDEVPELQLKDLNKIIVASGQHRLSALRRYHQALQDEYQILEKKRHNITSLKNLSDEHTIIFNKMRTEMCTIKGIMEGLGQWGVVVYDQDKLLADGDELAAHLSRNNTLHDYKETDEELLITVLKKVKSVYDTSPMVKRDELAWKMLVDLRSIQDKNSRLQRVLHQDGLCMFLATHLLQLGPHFRRRSEFSITWLSKSIDVCMGVYLSWIEMRAMTLKKLGSKGAFPNYKTVTELLDNAEAGDADAIAQVDALRKSIDDCPIENEVGDLSMWAEVLQALDDHAKEAFAPIIETIGKMTPKYISHLSLYQQNVLTTLEDMWSVSTGKDYGSNDILQYLDRVVARVAIHLTPQEGNRHAPEPLLGGTIMDHAWSTFMKLREGIGETCRWFEVLLDYYKALHPKAHTMDDWSTIMLRNIARDSRFANHHNENSRAVTDIIWTHRDTLMLRLTNLMMNEKKLHAPRPKDKKELQSKYESLPDIEVMASDTLTTVLMSRRTKGGVRSRDLAMEPQSIAGMMALHTTSWDWLNPALKNGPRDLDPCMKAIAVERQYLQGYRPKLLRDKLVGALRRLIEIELASRVRKIRVMDPRTKKMYHVKEWVWWDGLTLPSTQLDPNIILKTLEDNTVNKQQQTQARLALEADDRQAIEKLIAYFTNHQCVRASNDPTALASYDVMGPFQQVIAGIEINCARKRFRTLNGDPNMPFDLQAHDCDLRIQLPDSYTDPFTIGYDGAETEDNEEDEEDAPVKQPSSISKVTQHAVDRLTQPASETEPAGSTTSPMGDVIDAEVTIQPPPASTHLTPPNVSEPVPVVSHCAGVVPKARPIAHKRFKQASVAAYMIKPPTSTMATAQDTVPDTRVPIDSQDQGVDEEPVTPRPASRPLSEASAYDSDTTSSHGRIARQVCGCISLSLPSNHRSYSRYAYPPRNTAVATVLSEEPSAVQRLVDNGDIFSLSPFGPVLTDMICDVGTHNIGWFNLDPDQDEDERMDEDSWETEMDIEEDEEYQSDDLMTDTDDSGDDTYIPSRPLAQNLPPRKNERRGVPTSSTKRSRTETGASSSSSTQGRGMHQKKKPKIIQRTADSTDQSPVSPM
ncbi:hypothetical protein BDR03DRAFT_1018334 [Suillus americanus]|nr:hypothetical protein BDR03DRAFT_1018334 [Suillus americanus]